MKKHFHKVIGILGFFIFLFSLVLTFFTNYSYFYTFFLLGSWFILDYVNFKFTGKSIINFLFKKTNAYLIFLFLIVNAVAAFLVDYLYGVRIVQMWEWTNYGVWHWVVMIGFMTVFFCFVVYETYRFFLFILSKEFRGNMKNKVGKKFEKIMIYLGFFMLLIPLINYLFFNNFYPNYFLIFAFIGIWFICDGFADYFGGRTIISKILNGNLKVILSIILSTVFLAVLHEFLNFFSVEWKYINAPFQEIAIYGIPISVLIGWLPLVIFCISVVNLVKIIVKRNKNLY
jgi:hypothetical protein